MRGNLVVELFDRLHLGGELAVFAGAVGVLVVQEEKVVLAPERFHGIDLLGQGRPGVGDVHADEASQTLVHRIYGDAHGLAGRIPLAWSSIFG